MNYAIGLIHQKSWTLFNVERSLRLSLHMRLSGRFLLAIFGDFCAREMNLYSEISDFDFFSFPFDFFV